MSIEIPVRGAKAALVDDGSAALLSNFDWRVDASGYARAWVNGRGVVMHQLIMGLEDGKLVDHKNRDPLDNRRSNLRFATPLQNSANAKIRSDNTSGFKGVTWNQHAKRWKAQIRADGARVFLGYFRDASMAARAYDAKARVVFGEFAVLNFES